MTMKRFAAALILPIMMSSTACSGVDSPTEPPAPVATSITLSVASLSFASLGQTQQLTGAVLDGRGQPMPGATIIWTSSAADIVTVSPSGMVTSVGNGTTNLTATSGSAIATATATVQQVVASVTVDPGAASVQEGDSMQLSASTRDALGSVVAGQTVSWSSSNEAVARVGGSSGVTTGVSPGTATITATSDGLSGTAEITVIPVPVLQPSELCSDYSASAIATFADANLEAAVRTALGIDAGMDLTCGSLGTLTGFSAPSAGIASLAGIQNLTSLTDLNLYYNAISDVSPLSGLTSLAELRLAGNAISDVSPLSGLTNLTLLNFGNVYFVPRSDNNQISDISPLSGLTKLTVLGLAANYVTDVSALSGLTNLTTLDLAGNAVTDVSPLSGLTKLSDLDLGANAISDVSPLSGLTSLTKLSLFENGISDISSLSALTAMQFLWLQNNLISDISVLGPMPNLVLLYLSDNAGLGNIQPLLDNADNGGLGPGDTVYLDGTGVSCTDVAALAAKGATVKSSCP